MFVFAVPNGDIRDPITAKRLQSTGVRRGVADMCVMGGCRTVWIECKTDVGKQSPGQIIFEAKCKANKKPYILARPEMGIDNVVSEVLRLLYGN